MHINFNYLIELQSCPCSYVGCICIYVRRSCLGYWLNPLKAIDHFTIQVSIDSPSPLSLSSSSSFIYFPSTSFGHSFKVLIQLKLAGMPGSGWSSSPHAGHATLARSSSSARPLAVGMTSSIVQNSLVACPLWRLCWVGVVWGVKMSVLGREWCHLVRRWDVTDKINMSCASIPGVMSVIVRG